MTRYTKTKIDRIINGTPKRERVIGGYCEVCNEPIYLSIGQLQKPTHKRCRVKNK